jgi:Glycosyltransferase WbsX
MEVLQRRHRSAVATTNADDGILLSSTPQLALPILSISDGKLNRKGQSSSSSSARHQQRNGRRESAIIVLLLVLLLLLLGSVVFFLFPTILQKDEEDNGNTPHHDKPMIAIVDRRREQVAVTTAVERRRSSTTKTTTAGATRISPPAVTSITTRPFTQQVRVLAFVFPQFHLDSINNRLWGDNFTDWDSLRAAPLYNRYGDRIPRPATTTKIDGEELLGY